MKVEKLQLQPYDNIDSILDKMTQIYQVTRGLTQLQIIWPRRGRVIEEPLDYGRIAGWAERNGLDLAFITNEPLVAELALEQGIPVYPNTEGMPKNSVFRQKRFMLKRSDSQRMIKLARLRSDIEKTRGAPAPNQHRLPFFFLGIAAALVVFYLIIPHANVAISTVPQKRELKFQLWTNDQLEAFTMNGGVPSEQVHFTLDQSVSVPATGTIESTARLATGKLILTNNCDREQQLPANIHLSLSEDQPWMFHTIHPETIAPNISQEFAVEADSPGAKYNLPTGSLNAIQVPYNNCITVQQMQPTVGGDDGLFITPTEADYENAAAQIRNEILQRANNLMQEWSGALNFPLAGSFTIEKVIAETQQPEAGYAGETLFLEQKIQISFRMISQKDIYRQAELAFKMFPQEGFHPQDSKIDYQVLTENQNLSEGQYTIDVIAEQSGIINFEPDEIRTLIRGKSVDAAANIIRERYNTTSDPEINIWPGWISRLPIAPSNIWIKTQ